MLHALIINALGELRRRELILEMEQIRREVLAERSSRGRGSVLTRIFRWNRSASAEGCNLPLAGEEPSR